MADKHIRLLVSAEVKKAIKDLNKTEKATGGLTSAMRKLSKSAKLLAGAAALGFLVKRSVETSATFEALQTRLVALKGSVAAGTKAFETFNSIAKTTPFQLENVVEAGAQLEAFGADSEKTLKSVTDLAAFMGVDVVEAANAFGRAFAGGAGAADVLRERGVLTQIKLASGFDDLSKLSLPEFRQAMIDTLTDPEGNISGATDLLAQTFQGLVSNFQDSLSQLQDSIGDLLAPTIKRVIKILKTGTDALTEQFKQLGETDLQTTLRHVKELGGEFTELAIKANQIEILSIDEQIGGQTATQVVEKINGLQQQIVDKASANADIRLKIANLTEKEAKELVLTNEGSKTRKELLEETIAFNTEYIKGIGKQVVNEQDVLLLLKQKKELEEEIKALKDPDPDGPAKVMADEEIRTKILKAASEQRKQIQEDEKISALGIEEFEATVRALEITEERKTKIIEDEIKKRQKAENEAHKKRIEQNLESAILQGQSAKQAAISVVKAEIAEAQAGLISSIMKSVPFPLNLALAAGAGSMIGKVTDGLFSQFQTGGSFITRGRTTLPIGNGVIVGDNASGMERVDITPLPSPTSSSGSNITINISAPLVDETVVETIIPAIRRAEKLNL
tara:strand:+ start:3754 stop:5616 length:1863 start_codon:yes stop_codon:yes gene_type:complete